MLDSTLHMVGCDGLDVAAYRDEKLAIDHAARLDYGYVVAYYFSGSSLDIATIYPEHLLGSSGGHTNPTDVRNTYGTMLARVGGYSD